MEIVWRAIQDYPNYVVSNTGLVKSFDRIFVDKLGRKRFVPGHILKLCEDRDGYYYVWLHGENEAKFKKVHRLVAEAFIPNPDKLPEVNHKDEDKKNNCVDNLEWCEHYYNMMYGTCRKRQSENIKGSNNPMYGKTHSKEAREKISQANKNYQMSRGIIWQGVRH